MSKDIYEQLGLEGKPSYFNKKIPSRYVVTIDLVKSSFRPGKKNYRRIQWCLTNRLDLNLNVLVSWTPFGKLNQVCRVTIVKMTITGVLLLDSFL
jgi:hypothetical protein